MTYYGWVEPLSLNEMTLMVKFTITEGLCGKVCMGIFITNRFIDP